MQIRVDLGAMLYDITSVHKIDYLWLFRNIVLNNLNKHIKYIV